MNMYPYILCLKSNVPLLFEVQSQKVLSRLVWTKNKVYCLKAKTLNYLLEVISWTLLGNNRKDIFFKVLFSWWTPDFEDIQM